MHTRATLSRFCLYRTNLLTYIIISIFLERIPVHFIKRNYIQNGQYVMLKVGDRSWEVRFVISGKVQGSFSTGWASFAKRSEERRVGKEC